MAGEISEAPVTKIDGGPQLNTDAYQYDSQPAVKAAVSGTSDSSRTTTDTVVSGQTVTPVKLSKQVAAPIPVRAEMQATVRTNGQTPTVVTGLEQQTGGGSGSQRVGNCHSINYGDSGSSAHAYDSWTAGSDRSHAAQGSLAQQWWQASDQAPTNIQTDQQNLYSVQFGDSLSAIAKRELTTEGKAVTRENLKAEEDLIVSLNDCHYQSLDNNRDAIMAGWKLLLKTDATPSPNQAQTEQPRPAPGNVQPENLTIPQSGTNVDYMHHYTAIALINPQSHFHFTPSQGPNAQKDIDLLATGQVQRGDVVLYEQPGQLARVVYLGPNDHRPPNKQINPDGTVGPVTDPAFINWTNNAQRQAGQPEQPQIVLPPGSPGYRRRQKGSQQIENSTPQPIAQPQPLAPVADRHAYNGPIPHYTAVPFSAGSQILFSPATGKSAGARVDVAALDQADLQSTDVLLVLDGALASVYYMNGHVDSRPPNKQIKDDGTVGRVADQEFTDWSRSYYGASAVAPPSARTVQTAAAPDVIPQTAKVLPTVNAVPAPIAKPQPAATTPASDNQSTELTSATIDAP